MKTRAPFLLHLLAALFLLTGLIHLLGIFQAVRSWNWLEAAGYSPSPIYAVFKNSLLGLAFLAAGVLLWLRYDWGLLLDAIIVGLATVWFWVERVVLTQNPLPFKEHLFYILASGVIVTFCLLSLDSLHPFMRNAGQAVEQTGEIDE